MPVVPPNISTLSTPAIQVTSIGDVSYQTIQQSIGTYFYKINNIYIYSSNLSQLLQPIGLKKYTKTGSKEIKILQPMIDPYQNLSALNQTMLGLDYVFDSNNGFYPTISANTSVNFQFATTEISHQDYLQGVDNFQNIEYLQDYLNDF
jgi:hypothetical protein